MLGLQGAVLAPAEGTAPPVGLQPPRAVSQLGTLQPAAPPPWSLAQAAVSSPGAEIAQEASLSIPDPGPRVVALGSGVHVVVPSGPDRPYLVYVPQPSRRARLLWFSLTPGASASTEDPGRPEKSI